MIFISTRHHALKSRQTQYNGFAYSVSCLSAAARASCLWIIPAVGVNRLNQPVNGFAGKYRDKKQFCDIEHQRQDFHKNPLMIETSA
jgi:hypothetical protein